jgi:hypothetical protein
LITTSFSYRPVDHPCWCRGVSVALFLLLLRFAVNYWTLLITTSLGYGAIDCCRPFVDQCLVVLECPPLSFASMFLCELLDFIDHNKFPLDLRITAQLLTSCLRALSAFYLDSVGCNYLVAAIWSRIRSHSR